MWNWSFWKQILYHFVCYSKEILYFTSNQENGHCWRVFPSKRMNSSGCLSETQRRYRTRHWFHIWNMFILPWFLGWVSGWTWWSSPTLMTPWFYLTLLCNELFSCKWYAHSAFVWVWYLTVRDVLALSNSPDMNNRNSLKSFKDLPFYFTWAACFESGPCHKYSPLMSFWIHLFPLAIF